MIRAADTIIREVLLAGVPGLTSQRLSFQPPDDNWRTRVGAADGVSVNAYLCDIHEDRKLRSNAIDRVIDQGIAHDTPAPARIRLTYAISAWSAANDTAENAATEAEHDTLSSVLQALLRAAPLNAARVLTPAQLATVPPAMREAELPTAVAPPEGFTKLAEFWSTMGKGNPLKPVVALGVTVPVTFPETVIDGIVLTIDTGVGDERLVLAGGHVLDSVGANAAQPIPVRDASVVARTPAGVSVAATRTVADGSFVLDGLPPGPYELRFTADGFRVPPPVAVTLPQSAGGSIELLFT